MKVLAFLLACASLWCATDLVVIALLGDGNVNQPLLYNACAFKSLFFLFFGGLCWKRVRIFRYLAFYFVALSFAMWIVLGYWASPFLSETDLSRVNPKTQKLYATVEPNWVVPLSMIAISILTGCVLFKIDSHEEKSRMQSKTDEPPI